MESVSLKEWTFRYDSNKTTAIAGPEKISFLTKDYDNVHLVIEIEADLLVFQPRWSTKITEVETDTFLIEINKY
uniref:hypothetical protein n=1 Tax=Candidatus Enterococcus willemsii TaxID=1857215 RepID=UPI00403F7E89